MTTYITEQSLENYNKAIIKLKRFPVTTPCKEKSRLKKGRCEGETIKSALTLCRQSALDLTGRELKEWLACHLIRLIDSHQF